MKITELKDKIIIAELDPDKDYILLAARHLVNPQSLEYARGKSEDLRKIPVIYTDDVNNALRFIEVPKPKKGKGVKAPISK